LATSTHPPKAASASVASVLGSEKRLARKWVGELDDVALGVTVDVVRVVLVLDERPIHEDLRNPDPPQLANHDLQVLEQHRPPPGIPVRIPFLEPFHQHRALQLFQRHLIVPRWQETVFVKRWEFQSNTCSPNQTHHKLYGESDYWVARYRSLTEGSLKQTHAAEDRRGRQARAAAQASLDGRA